MTAIKEFSWTTTLLATLLDREQVGSGDLVIRLLVVPTDVIDLDKCFDLEDDKIKGNENVEV